MATQNIRVLGYGVIENAVLNPVSFTGGGTYADSSDYINISGDMVYTANQMVYDNIRGSHITETLSTFPVSMIVEKSQVVSLYQGPVGGYTSL